MAIKIGIEKLIDSKFDDLKGKKVALLSNPASINSGFEYSADIFAKASKKGIFRLKALFGPQQGIFETQQANMVEWEGTGNNRYGIPIYSLYGKTRKPTLEMLKGIEVFVIDLQDIGAKGYTFISTLYYVMEAAMENDIEVMVLDRPNPLGRLVEGPITDERFKSFVGIHNIPMRHGLTMAEMALLFQKEVFTECRLKILKMQRWRSSALYIDLNRPWIPITPNIPAFQSALCFPGMELLEGTNISEGRGTTKPFEQCGAPFIDPYKLAKKISGKRTLGAFYRPVSFSPTFDKWKDMDCYGVFVHITNPWKFLSVKSALEIIITIASLNQQEFKFTDPPYEYEQQLKPFDILVGTDNVRKDIENGLSYDQIEKRWKDDIQAYRKRIEPVLLYKRK